MYGIFNIIYMYLTSHPTLIFGNFRFCVMCICTKHSLPQSPPFSNTNKVPLNVTKQVNFICYKSHSFFLSHATAFNCYVCFLEFCSIYLLKSISLPSNSMNKSSYSFQDLIHYFALLS
jgi:hypothetical protein